MATDPVSAGVAAVSTIAGLKGQSDATKEARKQRKAGNKLTERQVALYDRYIQALDQATESGAFNAEPQIAQLESDTARYEARDAGGAASAATRAGYAATDTPVQRNLARVKLNYRDYLDRARLMLRRQGWLDRFSAISGAPTNALNPGIELTSMRERLAQANQPNPAGLFQSMMPFLRGNMATAMGGGGGFGSDATSDIYGSPVRRR